jgi:ABC-type lipoprotein release transport system permease subunit
VEDWQTGNADQLAKDNVLGAMTPMIAISIMMVAAFGTFLGLCLGAILIGIVSEVYVGPPIGYFPAKKAAKVDSVEIFRK